MKIKQSIYLLALVLVLLLPSGCKKFLEQTDTSNIAEDALFKKPQDAILLVNALYNTFDPTPSYDVLKFSIYYINNYLTLEQINYGGDRNWANYGFTPDHVAFAGLWDQFYKGIASANTAIPIIAKMKDKGILTQSLADRLTGEAYFLRGLFYYYLGSAFGGVPLELKTVTDNGQHPRNTQDEVFASVESDMKTAVDLLPAKENTEDGRATKGAALGYLGSAQMWLKKYTDAIATFNQIPNTYRLLPKYLDIHEYKAGNKSTDESLFDIKFLIPAGGTRSWGRSNDANWLQSFNMPEEITGMGYESASPKLYASFENGDTRKLPTVIGPGDEHPSPAIAIKNYLSVQKGFASGDQRYIGDNGQIINTAGTVSKPWLGSDPAERRTGYFNVKTWRDPNVVNGNDSLFGDQAVVMLRLGEILVSKAEAQFKSGDPTGAMATIQQIRDRAWGKLQDPSIVVPPPVETEMMKIIIDEYRHEINGEMSLWFDLRRAGELINFLKDKHGFTIPAGRDLMPIPAAAVATNRTLVQNPGY
ncbi:MAG: RagB/SusD family nutrient uptake outer membrane protein [Bacteroidetes bacterium]|nr:RagB/SusD family nutrient uptake outer membrane protein [Bacteroidota bacterium]